MTASLPPHPLARAQAPRRWIPREEAAAILGVSTRQVRRLEVRGELRVSRPSARVVLIDRQSIDAMLERHVEEYPTSAATPPHELAV